MRVVMGKAKKRSLHLGINDRISNLSREDAAKIVASKIKKNSQEVYGLITLFGLTAEELLESGADYEAVIAVRGLLK